MSLSFLALVGCYYYQVLNFKIVNEIFSNSKSKGPTYGERNSFWKRQSHYRSSHPEVFCKKGIFKKNGEILRKTPVSESLFNKVAGLQPAIFFKKRFQHRCFTVEFAKFLRTNILYNICKTAASVIKN